MCSTFVQSDQKFKRCSSNTMHFLWSKKLQVKADSLDLCTLSYFDTSVADPVNFYKDSDLLRYLDNDSFLIQL